MSIDVKSMDLYNYTYDLVRQIPWGYVSTYGAVANALGDVRASRSVGRMMNQNPDADTMPCFKIVHSDGRIGGFGLGIDDKKRRLQEENIQVEDERIKHFEQVYFDDFKTEYPLKKLRDEQLRLRSKILLKDTFDTIETVAGFDIAYPENDWDVCCGACVVYDYQTGQKIEDQVIYQKTFFPYIPTYLSYREAPFIENLLAKLSTKPTVLLIDGNGVLHPYHYGIACYVGMRLDMPTIGVAKSKLCGTLDERTRQIYVDGHPLGYAFACSPRIKKPMYISPGHKISVDTAVTITKNLSKTKHPEPLKQAHNLATRSLKGI
ncbi:MAG: endonuclease V [Candidatus Thermoplasmatota archaeon]|nr:endonuclease V [Candidatus Thermoplasmatota archaeon]